MEHRAIRVREVVVANQTELTSNLIDVSPIMLDATQTLAQNLQQSEPFLHYQMAVRKLHGDRTAMQLLADLAEAQRNIREQQYSNTISDRDLNHLRELQNAIRSNDAILAYGIAQQEAIAFLREVNDAISNLIGIDFASLTRRSGCCG
jgi:cell fate (sporulation/competence/biofilm development) regulator YlbF (YheA/YmcA/DUF963 family)